MTFKPMLAETADINKLEFPLLAQPKFDGLRCVVLPELGPVSRTLKRIPNHFVRTALTNATYHDGEIVTYTNDQPDSLYEVQSKIMSESGFPVFKFHVFDHVEHPSDPYEQRQARITTGHKVLSQPIYSLDTLLDYEQTLIALGWEGVILRKPGSHYKFGRSTLNEGILLKLKRFSDSEAKVIGFTEKMTNLNDKTTDERGYAKRSSAKHGKVESGMLGALIMLWNDSIEFEIGSGFDTNQRIDIWENQSKYLNRSVTFKYHRCGPNGKPLLPIFRCFRADA